MKTTLTRLFTVMMLIMVSLGAKADVKVLFGEKGESTFKSDAGTIEVKQDVSKKDATKITVYLIVTPSGGYTLEKDNSLEVYAVISPDGSSTRALEVLGDALDLTCSDFKDISQKRTYTVDIDPNLALWVKSAKFTLETKGNRSVGPVTTSTADNPVYYLIQSYQTASFYMLVNGSKVNTLNVMSDNMKWYFVDAGTEDDTQFYYIVNTNGKYIYFSKTTGGSNNRTWAELKDFDSATADNFKFSLSKNATREAYNIIPKGGSTSSLNKAGKNLVTSDVQILGANGLNDDGSCWNFIAETNYTKPEPPFDVSSDSNIRLYKIQNLGKTSYYFKQGGFYSGSSGPYAAVTSNDTNDEEVAKMNFYFKEAGNDNWRIYYNIISQTGNYLYYRASDKSTDNAVVLKDYSSTESEQPKYQFFVVKGYNGGYDIISRFSEDYSANDIASLKKVNENNNRNIASTGRRGGNEAEWNFISATPVCESPVIAYEGTDKIRITTATEGATIYYTVNGSDPSDDSNTDRKLGINSSFTIDVSDGLTVVKAYAEKSGYDPSEVTAFDLTVEDPVITYDPATNQAIIMCSTSGATIYYTTDGSESTTESTSSSSPVSITLENTILTVRAIAKKGGVISSVTTKACIKQGSGNTVLLQNKECTDFYMTVGDVSGTNTTVNTSSLPQAGMSWHFEDAGTVDGVQYYYIYNTSKTGYLQRNGDNLYIVGTNTNDDSFKFSITPYYDGETLSGYNIYSKAASKYVYKDGGNATTGLVKLNGANNANYFRWDIIAESNKSFTALVNESTSSSVTYYTIASSAATDYLISTPSGTAVNVTTTPKTPSTDSQKWYFKEAGNDGWATYYYILNAVTGEAMCFNKEAVNTTQTDALVMNVLPNEPTDNFKFTLAKTMNADEYYIIPKPLAHFTKTNYTGVWRAGNTAILQTSANRATNNIKWKVSKAEEGYVAPPVISYNPTTNEATITCTTPEAKIYYTITDTEATTSADKSLETVPFTFTLEEGTLVLRAIAHKDGVGTSSETKLAIPVQTTDNSEENKRPYLIRNYNNRWAIDEVSRGVFYMIPGDDDGSGNTTVNTSSLLRPTMEWLFKYATTESGTVYYYIVNASSGYYLYYDSSAASGSQIVVKAPDSFSDTDNGYKFRLPSYSSNGTLVGYNIQPYSLTSGNRFLHKGSNNDNPARVTLSNSNSGANSLWTFVTHNDLNTTPPFTVSDGNSTTYYKLSTNSTADYYVSPAATAGGYVTTSNIENDNQNWYFMQAATSDWLTYYNIRNAVTGEYLYFNGTSAASINAFEMHGGIDSENADRYQFSMARSSTENRWFIVPKVIENTQWNNISTIWRDNTNALKTQATRNNGNAMWQFTKNTNFTCAAPVITYNALTGKVSINCSTIGDVKIYYKHYDSELSGTDIPTQDDNLYDGEFDAVPGYYKAVAIRSADGSDRSDAAISDKIDEFHCLRPLITVSAGHVTITCATPGATIYYIQRNNDDPEISFDEEEGNYGGNLYAEGGFDNPKDIIKAIAIKGGVWSSKSEEALYDTTPYPFTLENVKKNMNGVFYIDGSFSEFDDPSSATDPFTGVLDGKFLNISIGHPLFAYVSGATIKNVIISSASINESGNAGAIANVATGDTRIYNCGVLGGSVSGGSNVGGLVGLLDGSARVINCYSFANVSGGTYVGGIVGYNNYASTVSDIRTMVMNCMFYGDITRGTHISPIYGGVNITNVSNLNGYNYYLYGDEAPYSKKASGSGGITDYNCALAAETKYLTRFEFFRYMLNSNRELAAWYATDDATKGKGENNEMAKWVLDGSYPILKRQAYYPSVVNYEDAPTMGSISLTVTLTNGATSKEGCPTSLTIYDKDLTHNHFNYYTVRLPYFCEVANGNYGSKVVTGWKITGMDNGTQGHYTTGLDYSATTAGEGVYAPYNFADRNCTGKDLYSVSGRVFSQGAYFDVPEGVTGITIEPYWGKAVYLSDPTYDVAYPKSYGQSNAVNVIGTRPTTFNGQTVYTTFSGALSALGSASGTVYDNAIVLVGNYHHYWGATSPTETKTKSFTIMSADLDNDCEPDYGLICQHGTGRQSISPIRFDFINSPGLGMIQKVETDAAIPKHGIWYPTGWFEVTNTALIQFTQFEYDAGGKNDKSPLILLGGIYDQFVTSEKQNANSTEYIHLGSNVWMKMFSNGIHMKSTNSTRHVPISVTGGEFGSFYLTGNFSPNASVVTDNAECYINGGKFGEVAGAGQEQLNGDITWLIDHANMDSFYGGGVNGEKEVTGNIYVEINNSTVGTYCGGPKFGNMHSEKKVTTKAEGTTFTKFFGAGYGGTSYNKSWTKDETSAPDYSWDSWVNSGYTRDYSSTNKGIATEYEYELIPLSGGQSGNNVGRFYVKWASLSMAQTKNVETTLTDCDITESFYGGGNLGRVDGTITSTLKGCRVGKDVFGGGFSATAPTIMVFNKGAKMNPNPSYNATVGIINDGKYPEGDENVVEYTWSYDEGSTSTPFTDTADGKHYIYTDQNLDILGEVDGIIRLTIEDSDKRNSQISGSVYGGGDMSKSLRDVIVTLRGSTSVGKDVFGGGNKASVAGNTKVNIE